jgi:effector-binding domain-containing protein
MLTNLDVMTREVPAQQVAALRLHTSMQTIGHDIAAGFNKVDTAMEVVGVRQFGRPFIVFHGRIDDVTGGDIEICSPVVTPFHGVEEVYGAEIPGGTIASTIHRGSYDDIAGAYAAVIMWIDEHGLEPAGSPREYYLNDLGTTKPEDLLTEIAFPIRWPLDVSSRRPRAFPSQVGVVSRANHRPAHLPN